MLFPEAFLNRMEPPVLGQSLDRQYPRAIGLHRQHQAGFHRLALKHHRADAAAAFHRAAHVSAGEARHFSDKIDQQHPVLHRRQVELAVDRDRHLGAHRMALLIFLCSHRQRAPWRA